MQIRHSVIGLALTLTLAPTLIWAQTSCAEILYAPIIVQKNAIRTEAEVSKKTLNFMNLLGSGNTTSLRQEDKYVVSEPTVDRALKGLADQHGPNFQLRDQKQDGRKNVTDTQYALPFKWINSDGKSGSGKIRFRKYFDTDSSVALGQAPLVPAAIVKDRQFVEFKIDHPLYDQVVIKPRMVVMDTDVKMMKSQKMFSQNKKQILERTLQLNPKVPAEVVGQFFEIFSDVYAEPVSELPLFAQTTYVRDSYSLLLKSLKGESVEIQLTVDREIMAKDSRTQKVISAYRPEDVVVELKVPLAYSKLTIEDLAQVPGLDDVVQLKKLLEMNHERLYAKGSGKLSTFKKAQKDLLEFVGD